MMVDYVIDSDGVRYLLRESDIDDIGILVDYITNQGEGRVSLADDICKQLAKCKETGIYSEADRWTIENEICRFGGNTVTNIIRDLRNSKTFLGAVFDRALPEIDKAVPYGTVVRDVATHLKVSFNNDSSIPTIEDGILRKILSELYEEMSAKEKKAFLDELDITDFSHLAPAATGVVLRTAKAAGFITYKIAAIVANAIAKIILGRGLTFAGNRLLMRIISITLGPVGWALNGIWAVSDIASPAYRVTIPCVIQLAYMRQKLLIKEKSQNCQSCGSINIRNAKFCSGCGQHFTP